MKILLITNYWHPYNNPGAIRWINFRKFIDFDILTCKIPLKGFKDNTMPFVKSKVFRFGIKLPAIIWGIFSLIPALFLKYDVYIITCPPESLLFTGYILQFLGKKVIIDMRDAIERDEQPYKFLVPFYKFFYNKLKNVFVCWELIDSDKIVIYHGYDIDKRHPKALSEPIYYKGNINYKSYMELLSMGIIKDYSDRPKDYPLSKFHNIKKLNYPILSTSDEYFGIYSWEYGASQIIEMIKKMYYD